MLLVTKSGRRFEKLVDPYFFTKEPLIVVDGLNTYLINGEEVSEDTFMKELGKEDDTSNRYRTLRN